MWWLSSCRSCVWQNVKLYLIAAVRGRVKRYVKYLSPVRIMMTTTAFVPYNSSRSVARLFARYFCQFRRQINSICTAITMGDEVQSHTCSLHVGTRGAGEYT